jgi:hypothetical protein
MARMASRNQQRPGGSSPRVGTAPEGDSNRRNTRDWLQTADAARQERDNKGQGGGRPPAGGGRGADRGPAGPRNDRPDARQGGGPVQPPRPAAPERPDLRYLLVSPQGNFEADVYESAMPLRWSSLEVFGALLKPGLYMQKGGSLSLVSRDVKFDKAVMFVQWDDPHQTYRTADGRDVKPGLHVGFLVKSPNSDGPPWLPVIAPVQATPLEVERGLLSPWHDQVAAVRFGGSLTIDKKGLSLSSEGKIEEDSGSDAVLETMCWLADHPNDESTAGAIARRILVDNGHGLQRLGLALMHETEGNRHDSLTQILRVLAPDVAPLLESLWNLFHGTEPARERFVALARTLSPMLSMEHPSQRPGNLSLVATWLSGLFGARPERENQQPARALYLAAHALREAGRHVETFEHADAFIPSFPLDSASVRHLVRALGSPFKEPTPLEGLFRVLATAEAGWDIVVARREHLRAFAPVYDLVRRYPIGGRTVAGRYDYVLTSWSFRGFEVRSPRADLRGLGDDLLLDAPSVAMARAYSRVLGVRNNGSAALAHALDNHEHPGLARLATFFQASDAEVLEQFETSSSQKRLTRDALYTAVSAAEFLISGMESKRTIEGFLLPSPEFPEQAGSGIRGHFMYWRMFCRSTRAAWAESYSSFLATALPRMAELPNKLQTEVLALLNSWLRFDANHRNTAKAWQPSVEATVARVLGDLDEVRTGGDERLQQAMRALLDIDSDAWFVQMEGLLDHEAFTQIELHRLLMGVRMSRGVREPLVRHTVFRRLHRRLADLRTAQGAWARGEWTRLAVERARKAGSLDWLLDARTQARLLASSEFIEWFSDRGQKAIEDADSALIELLELAVAVAPDAQIDLALQRIARATLWPANEVVKVLLNAGRPEAAIRWMRSQDIRDAEAAAGSFGRILSRARSGAQFRTAAEALVLAESYAGQTLTQPRTDLLGAMSSYRPLRHALHGLVDVTTAWRLANLSPTHDAAMQLAERCATWFLDSGDEDLLAFLRWIVESSLLEAWPALVGAAATGTLTGDALAATHVPRGLGKVLRVLSNSGARDQRRAQRFKDLRRALLAPDAFGPVSEALIRELGGVGMLPANRLQALLEALPGQTPDEPVEVVETTAESVDSTEPSTDEPAETAVETAAEAAEAEAEDTAGPNQRRSAHADAVFKRFVHSLSATFRRLVQAASDDTDSMVASTASLQSTQADWSLRADVLARTFSRLGSLHVKADDPGNVLVTPDLDGVTVNVDLSDIDALLALLVSAQRHAGLAAQAELTRNGLLLPGFLADAQGGGESDADASDEPGDDHTDTEDAGDDIDDADRSDGDASDAGAEAGAARGARRRKRSKAPMDLLRKLHKGLQRNASAHNRLEAFGSASEARRFAELLDRNPDVTLVLQEGRNAGGGRRRQRPQPDGIVLVFRARG